MTSKANSNGKNFRQRKDECIEFLSVQAANFFSKYSIGVNAPISVNMFQEKRKTSMFQSSVNRQTPTVPARHRVLPAPPKPVCAERQAPCVAAMPRESKLSLIGARRRT